MHSTRGTQTLHFHICLNSLVFLHNIRPGLALIVTHIQTILYLYKDILKCVYYAF